MYTKKTYKGLDLGKFMCALLVLFLHSYCNDWGIAADWFHDVITPVAVPFFFIVSGFFFGKGLQKRDSKAYTKDYSLRILKMYVIWSIITLPVAQICIQNRYPDASLLFQIIYSIRLFLLTGSIGIYWYLLSLVICSWIIYFTVKWEKYLFCFCFSAFFFAIGVIYDTPMAKGFAWAEFIHVIWGSERNFLNVGLIYMLIGYFFSTRSEKGNWGIWMTGLIISTILKTIEWKYFNFHLFQLPMSVFLFLICKNSKMDCTVSNSLKLRKFSTALYLGHFPILLLFDFHLLRGTLIDYTVISILSLTIYFIVCQFPKQWQQAIYG